MPRAVAGAARSETIPPSLVVGTHEPSPGNLFLGHMEPCLEIYFWGIISKLRGETPQKCMGTDTCEGLERIINSLQTKTL
jgi:hypothetical protein